VTRARVLQGRAPARLQGTLRFWHRRDGAKRTGPWRGTQSPWKKRASSLWQRRHDATDSSAEQSLEVGRFARFRRAPRHPLRWDRRRARSVRSFGCGANSDPLREARDGVSAATSGSESAPAVARLPTHVIVASASATLGDSHATTTGASAPARGVCSVMWGSASADRSIIASESLPRTPSPAFGLGPRLFRASRCGSSEPRRPVPAPAGTPRPDGADPATEAGPPVFGPADPPRGTRRRSSSEPRPPPSPRFRAPGSSEPGRPLPAPRPTPPRRAPPVFGPADPPRGTRRRSSSEPRPPPSRDPAPRFFGIGTPRPQGSASSPFGARSPIPRLVHGRTPPASAGIAVGVVTGFGRRTPPGRTATTGRQRSQ